MEVPPFGQDDKGRIVSRREIGRPPGNISIEIIVSGRPISLHFIARPCHFEGEDSAAINNLIGNKLFALASTEKPPQLR
ncbi:MAG: hypothetical protein IH594_07600 [Bacteroidales bacterium]|nr:hypothetical protein [Bacteroidales bacterium]